MKTHVIQLDSNDDFISIRDKTGWVKAPRILIVWPDIGRIKIIGNGNSITNDKSR